MEFDVWEAIPFVFHLTKHEGDDEFFRSHNRKIPSYILQSLREDFADDRE